MLAANGCPDSSPKSPFLKRTMFVIRRQWILLIVASLVVTCSGSARGGDKDAPIDYNRDILPILANNCLICHGPAEQKAGLRLDQREVAIKPARSKATPIQPGKAS